MRRPTKKKRPRKPGFRFRRQGAGIARRSGALSGELIHTSQNPPSLFHAANLWQFGDWAALAALSVRAGTQTKKAGTVALLSASANFQLGSTRTAKALLKTARQAGCTRKELLRMLIAGAHLNLGRASCISGRGSERQTHHFKSAAAALFGSERARSADDLIKFAQLSQLERPVGWCALALTDKATKFR